MRRRSLWGVCALAVLAAAVVAWLWPRTVRETLPDDAPLAAWMAFLREDAPLVAVALPGAHDAATAGMPWVAETQRLSVRDQLLCGTRYLDLRVARGRRGGLRIFHGPVVGAPLEPLLGAVRDFLGRNPSETLLLDFQHFRGGSEGAAAQQVERILGPWLLRAPEEGGTCAFLRGLRLADVRGRCLVFWGSVQCPSWAFPRVRTLRSRYVEAWHRQASGDFVAHALPRYLESLGTPSGPPVTVLQTQLTDAWGLRGPLWLERWHRPALDGWVEALRHHPRLAAVNVVLRDDVGPGKNAAILRLNRAKGWVRTDRISTFDTLTEGLLW